jgi:hypothetical protein
MFESLKYYFENKITSFNEEDDEENNVRELIKEIIVDIMENDFEFEIDEQK